VRNSGVTSDNPVALARVPTYRAHTPDRAPKQRGRRRGGRPV
jgi:hypothetical protein